MWIPDSVLIGFLLLGSPCMNVRPGQAHQKSSCTKETVQPSRPSESIWIGLTSPPSKCQSSKCRTGTHSTSLAQFRFFPDKTFCPILVTTIRVKIPTVIIIIPTVIIMTVMIIMTAEGADGIYPTMTNAEIKELLLNYKNYFFLCK